MSKVSLSVKTVLTTCPIGQQRWWLKRSKHQVAGCHDFNAINESSKDVIIWYVVYRGRGTKGENPKIIYQIFFSIDDYIVPCSSLYRMGR